MKKHVMLCDNCGAETTESDPMYWHVSRPRTEYCTEELIRTYVGGAALDFCSWSCVAQHQPAESSSHLEN